MLQALRRFGAAGVPARGPITAAVVVAAMLCGGAARSEEPESQRATAADMVRLFEPFIGVFRSPDYLYDDGKTEHHFRISYDWFDGGKTIVKFRVTTEIPSLARTLVNSEGYYWFDPVRERIAVFGAFTHGHVGSGSIIGFDHEAGTRVLRATNIGQDGAATEVRDSFKRIDANTWRNRTAVRSRSDEWKVVHEGTYTRVPE